MAMPQAVLAVPSVLVGLVGTPWHSRFAALLNPEEAAVMAAHFYWREFLAPGAFSLAPMPALVAKRGSARRSPKDHDRTR